MGFYRVFFRKHPRFNVEPRSSIYVLDPEEYRNVNNEKLQVIVIVSNDQR